MPMSIRNNNAANLVLGEWKKNDSKLAKDLKRAASGTKLTSTGDGASEYSISEKMRVRIRALGQADDNVLTGASLLRVAEGGIQQQVDILRTIKQKVIDANNDSNTDLDRATIQKEIDQGYDQMQDIATETTYNGKRILFGGDIEETVRAWKKDDASHFVLDSDSMGVIPDNYDTLDGISGPFDIFKEYDQNGSTIPLLNLPTSTSFSGGKSGTPAEYELSFSNYTNVADLDGVGLQIGGKSYVFTMTPSTKYNASDTVDLSSCSSIASVVSALASKISIVGNGCTGTATGTTLTITTKDKSSSASATIQPYTNKSSGQAGRAAYTATGAVVGNHHLTGGADAHVQDPNDPDSAPTTPGAIASTTVDLSSATAGSGFTIFATVDASSKECMCIQLTDGTEALTYDKSSQTYLLGKNASFMNQSLANAGGLLASYQNGTFTLTAPAVGASYNTYYLNDGITSTTSTFKEAVTKGFNGTAVKTKSGTDGTSATCEIDLSNVPDTTNASDLEDVISQLTGKALDTPYDYHPVQFIDSSDSRSLASMVTYPNATAIDLNALRSVVAGGITIKTALGNLIAASGLGTLNSSSNIVITSTLKDAAGNSDALNVLESQLNSYDVDYGTWFQNNTGASIPSDLYNKGFRFYCATDSEQWFNIIFTNGDEFEKSRPKSGTSSEDIKTVTVDVSKVTSATDLVNAIYDQANPYFTNLNHYYHLATNSHKGILTIYDSRHEKLANNPKYPDYQEKGAKIADGMYDNVDKSTRDILIDDLVIQNTDHASQNIHIHIPRTTIDQIFAYRMDSGKISDYNVMTKDMREQLLGNPPENPGILDRGLEYLASGLTLIGAQQNHLSHSHDNLTTQNENVTASESAIRDADMAKTMTDYARDNILSQSVQAMLAQANQSASSVLSLLQ